MKLETAEDGGRYVVPPPCFSRCREHKGYPRGKGLDEKNIGVARTLAANFAKRDSFADMSILKSVVRVCTAPRQMN